MLLLCDLFEYIVNYIMYFDKVLFEIKLNYYNDFWVNVGF